MTRRGRGPRFWRSLAGALIALPWAAAVLLALVFAPGAAAVDTDPTNLATEGLTFVLRLYRWTGSAWELADSSGVSTVELGDGDYRFTGLPLATGAQRYRLIVAEAAAPTAGLREWTYGARPGERLAWRHAIALPDAPRVFKVGDTAGAVELVIQSGLPSPIGDPATTATARLYDVETSTLVFSGRAATITGVVFDEVTASWGATLAYDVAAGDFAAPGLHRAEFTVCYLADPEDCHTLPSDDSLELHVRDVLGGPLP